MSKISNLQNATLILSTSSATTTNGLYTSFSWANINLRQVLGNMWDSYEQFNVSLIECGSAVSPSNLGSSLDDCNVAFVMTGLSFVNTRYYVQKQTILNQSIVGVFNYNRSSISNQVYYGNNVSTFDKSKEIVTLSINYVRVIDEVSPASSIAFPNTIFIFKIVGIPKQNFQEVDLSRRLKI